MDESFFMNALYLLELVVVPTYLASWGFLTLKYLWTEARKGAKTPAKREGDLSQRELQKLSYKARAEAKAEYLAALEDWESLNNMVHNADHQSKHSDQIMLADARVRRDFFYNQATIIGVELVD